MTDKLQFEGCERLMNHGDGHFQERSPLSLNGKRPLEPDSVLAREHSDQNSSKRSKTLTLPNGLERSSSGSIQPSQTTAIRNGYNDSTHDTKSGIKDFTEADQLNGDKVKPVINTEGVGNSAISKENTLTNSGTSNKTHKKEVVPVKGAASTEGRSAATESGEGSPGGAEPEIITLSDSEDEFQEVLTQAISRNSSNLKVVQLLKLYQDQLRAEESKLILLRKLKQSVTSASRPSNPTSTEATSKVPDGRNVVVAGQRGGGGNAPPPLKRGHQQSPHSLPNSSQSPHPKTTHHHHASLDRGKAAHIPGSTNSAGPPPLVNMAKSSSHTSGGSGSYNGYQAASVSQSKKAPPAPPKLSPEQTMIAAKMALRKQLEQALQQVPAPKPPPPEVNFLPSLASGEFIYLIGMEEVVKQLLSTDQKDVKFVFNPFSCVQCDADFTPVWKRDKPGSKNVICERCITSNQKQVLKQEHTTKLKAVFSKALLKEQEIERRVAAGSPLSDMPGLAATVLRHQQSSTAAASAAAPSMPQLTAQHAQSSPSPNSQQLSTSQLHQQALLQAQAEQMRAMLAAQMLPYQLYSGVGVTSKQAADIQRQYLLDMINQNRSSSSWKT